MQSAGNRTLLFILLALLGLRGTAWSTDVSTPEERLFALYNAGQVEEARAGFRKLVEERTAEVNELLAEKPDSEFRSTQTAWQIAALAETMVIWETAEILLQHRGGVTPPQVYTEVDERITQVDRLMERLETQREKKSWSKKENETGFENARKALQKSFTKTVAFLRKGGAPEKRQELLLRAAKRGGMPATLEEFDAKNSDLLKLFNIVLKPPVKKTVDDRPQARLADKEKDAELIRTLEAFYRGLFSGNLESLRPLVAPEVLSGPRLRQDLQTYAGWTLKSIDRIFVRQGEGGRIEVGMEEILATAKDGRPAQLRGDLVLRQTQEGTYQVVGL